ncbi:MAG: DUF2892 domain-containing protein [Gammaproteobacteria bacterium]|nr:DUF2892 domain-containing protein [Gammaproteobacteria bacterium]
MNYNEATAYSSGNISSLDRGFRISMGLAAIFTTLHLSITSTGADSVAYPVTMLLATMLVFTGMIGWDPAYAMYRKIVSRLTNIEAMTLSKGNISMPDRAIRIVAGMAILIAALETQLGGGDAFPFVKLFATLIVLTGIAGWDPLYSAFRSIMSYRWNSRPYGYMSRRGYI